MGKDKVVVALANNVRILVFGSQDEDENALIKRLRSVKGVMFAEPTLGKRKPKGAPAILPISLTCDRDPFSWIEYGGTTFYCPDADGPSCLHKHSYEVFCDHSGLYISHGNGGRYFVSSHDIVNAVHVALEKELRAESGRSEKN